MWKNVVLGKDFNFGMIGSFFMLSPHEPTETMYG
jgi:hypothetical protein